MKNTRDEQHNILNTPNRLHNEMHILLLIG
jgi:hypothetical protein